MIEGKVWGQTELLEANGVLEFHRIETKKAVCVQNTSISINGMVSLWKKVHC